MDSQSEYNIHQSYNLPSVTSVIADRDRAIDNQEELYTCVNIQKIKQQLLEKEKETYKPRIRTTSQQY